MDLLCKICVTIYVEDTRSERPNFTVCNVFRECQFTTFVKDWRHSENVLEEKMAKNTVRILRRCQSNFFS